MPATTQTVQLDAGTNHVSIPLRIASPKLWYPAGYGAQDRYRFSRRGEDRQSCRRTSRAEDRPALGRTAPPARPVGQELYLRRERNSDLRQGRERHSLRQLSQPRHPRALSPDSDGRARRQHEHGPRMGRRHLRERRLLRHLRRAWPDGLAGVHVRRRHGAGRSRVSAERARRSDAAGEAAARSSQHRALVRQQRSRSGMAGVGRSSQPSKSPSRRRSANASGRTTSYSFTTSSRASSSSTRTRFLTGRVHPAPTSRRRPAAKTTATCTTGTCGTAWSPSRTTTCRTRASCRSSASSRFRRCAPSGALPRPAISPSIRP